MAWALRQSIAWRQAALFPASSQREAAKEMSKRKPITREQLEQLIELLEQPVAPAGGANGSMIVKKGGAQPRVRWRS
jgi:hypothetical protein